MSDLGQHAHEPGRSPQGRKRGRWELDLLSNVWSHCDRSDEDGREGEGQVSSSSYGRRSCPRRLLDPSSSSDGPWKFSSHQSILRNENPEYVSRRLRCRSVCSLAREPGGVGCLTPALEGRAGTTSATTPAPAPSGGRSSPGGMVSIDWNGKGRKG